MKKLNEKMIGLIVAVAMFCIVVASITAYAGEDEKAPGWEALNRRAQSAALDRYSTEDLEVMVEKKEQRLDELSEQRSELRTALVGMVSATEQSLDTIDEIDDPVLRDESLLRFRDARDTRMASVQARLAAVEEEMQRERGELAVLRQLLQSRRVEAQLHGRGSRDKEPESYDAFLAAEAERVRAEDRTMVGRIHEHRVRRLGEVIRPLLSERRQPDPAEAVLLSNRSK